MTSPSTAAKSALSSASPSSSGRSVAEPHVLSVRQGDGIVLLDIDRGRYYGLTIVGARIWELICEQRSDVEIVEQLHHEFDAPHDTIVSDVSILIDALSSSHLVRRI